jgi:hypothetical protein
MKKATARKALPAGGSEGAEAPPLSDRCDVAVRAVVRRLLAQFA